MATPGLPCTGAMFTDSASGFDKSTGDAQAWPKGTTLSCQATVSAYAVTASFRAANVAMVGGDPLYWCVDSTGSSKGAWSHLASGQVTCP